MTRAIAAVNGILVVYVIGFVNAMLALVVAFGVSLNTTQQATIVAVVNASLVMVAHAAHSTAKRTESVIPAGPVDKSHENETGG